MSKEQKKLLIDLVKKERKRIQAIWLKVEEDTEYDAIITMKRELCDETIKCLQGGQSLFKQEDNYCYDCDGSGYAETGWQNDDGDEVVETCYECDGDGNVDEGGK